jgi:nucleoside-diphosphate-sugar epimerase
MTVLVTGASGLLGGHLVDALIERGERPRVLVPAVPSASSTPHVSGVDVDVHTGDVRDRATLEAATDGVDCVLHCAARTGPWGPEAEYVSTNITALETLVRVAREAGVRRVVHVSSITVHGNDVRGAADESTPVRVEPNPYSRSKVAGEQLLQRMIAEGAPVTIVRPGYVYGPRDAGNFGRFAEMIAAGRMVVIGSGANHLPLVYARDVADGMLLAAASPDAEGRTYLLVNDEPVTQRQYLDTIAAELGAPRPTRRIPYPFALMVGSALEVTARLARREQPPPLMRFGVQLLGGENRFSIARARAELGFAPRVSMADGVRRSVEWFRSGEVAPLAVGGR